MVAAILFVDYHDNLALGSVFHIVVAVLDDLVVEPLKNQQHLRVRHCIVLVGEQRLEVKYDEVLVRRD